MRVIEDHAFLYANVTSLHLPACFEEYGECAFWLRNLASITVDEGNPRYRSIDGWLYSKDSLTLCLVPSGTTGAVSVPQYVRHLGWMAFGFCGQINSVTLPEGLREIGSEAFSQAPLREITLPASVETIGDYPFQAYYLEKLTVLNPTLDVSGLSGSWYIGSTQVNNNLRLTAITLS